MNPLLSILLLGLGSVSAIQPALHLHLSAEEQAVLLGHPQQVPPYRLVGPEDVPLRQLDSLRRRSKRSVGGVEPSVVLIEFRAFDQLFRLRLTANTKLLSPSFHVVDENSPSQGNVSIPSIHRCFYQGYSETHPHSAVALSLCHGMQGVIETASAVFLVNPIPSSILRRIFPNSTSDPREVTHHVVIQKTSLQDYECPHKSRPRMELAHAHTWNVSLARPKRSIDVIGSNLNFLDADESPSTLAPPTSPVGGEGNSTARPVSFNITVETAVFVDESLHKSLSKTFPVDTEQQIVLYVLTIMNAVQLLFKQPSIGRSVEISVVLMDLLKTQPKNLAPSDNIDTYLTNFCVWQHKKRLRESGGPTPDWDHALLLSGINMYVVDGFGRRKRHVVGLAPVSGMCNSLNSCTISEGTSFQTVLVAGHEMGHSLGMEHDGAQDGNQCNRDDFVMSPTLGPGKTTWSECSRHYLDKFVLTPQATCVLGRSSHVNIIQQFIPRQQLPGERFDVDDQCRFRFGPSARHHAGQPRSEVCLLIKCRVKTPKGALYYAYPSKSAYNTHPALEGSECGQHRWCRQGRCVPRVTDAEFLDISSALNNEVDNLVVEADRATNKSAEWQRTSRQARKKSATRKVTKLNKGLYHYKWDKSRRLGNQSAGQPGQSEPQWRQVTPSAPPVLPPQPAPANPYSSPPVWPSAPPGQWSAWSPFGPCISECVSPRADSPPVGVQTSLRHCLPPNNRSSECGGPDTRVKLCNAVDVCSAASAVSAAAASPLGNLHSGHRHHARSVEEYISDTCGAASKINEKIEKRGTQYPSYDSSSHSCYVWCFKRGGGFLSQGWRMPDGIPCGRRSVFGEGSLAALARTGHCYNGQCRPFQCQGEWHSRSGLPPPNVFNAQERPSWNETCADGTSPDTEAEWGSSEESTYRLVPKVTTVHSTGPPSPSAKWSEWSSVTECQYSTSCITTGRGFRLVTRQCRAGDTCIGRGEALEVCEEIGQSVSKDRAMLELYEQYCPLERRRTANEYAGHICDKYRAKYPSLLSGQGRQLLSKNSGCIVACEDRVWRDIHYQMDAFEDGKFPFGTDCSLQHKAGYCLNGKCIHFDPAGISFDTDDSVLYRNEILQLFAPETLVHSVTDPIRFSVDSYSSIFSNELYKRATSKLGLGPSPVSPSLAYDSFMARTLAHRRMRRSADWPLRAGHFRVAKVRRSSTPPSPTAHFRKSAVQASDDPEADYVSWTLSLQRPAHLLQSGSRTWPSSRKSLRPVKLTPLPRHRSQPEPVESHLETFTLVRASRGRRLGDWLESRHLAVPLATPLHNARFLDDEEGEGSGQNETATARPSPLGMGHESWPEQRVRVSPYVWSVSLAECSRQCGQGVRSVRVVCTVGGKSVHSGLCDHNSKPSHKPVEPCKQRDCIGRWRTEPWSACASKCPSGTLYQSRSTVCVGPLLGEHYRAEGEGQVTPTTRLYSILHPKFCDTTTRPVQWRPCPACPPTTTTTTPASHQ